MTVYVYSLKDNRNDFCFNSKGERCKHFRVKEFACKDGSDVVFVAGLLIDVLEAMRELAGGRPISVPSGYRTVKYNASLKGAAKYSQHTHGTAADIIISGIDDTELVAKYAREVMPDYGGVGIYKGFVHVDVREKKTNWVG